MSDDTKHVYCMYESEIEDQLWSEMMLVSQQIITFHRDARSLSFILTIYCPSLILLGRLQR